MKMLVRIACIAWLQTGHHGKTEERRRYLIKICTFLFAFAVSEERNMFGKIRHYDNDFCAIRMSLMPVGCSLSQDNS